MWQVLNVLQYLESLSPPVVHRDIKPENIVFDPATGRIQVVDFGGVQKMAALGPNGPLGSTVVGTYGFMAPEQFQNRASSQSDLYSLGATVLFLLSGGVPPSDFPQVRVAHLELLLLQEHIQVLWCSRPCPVKRFVPSGACRLSEPRCFRCFFLLFNLVVFQTLRSRGVCAIYRKPHSDLWFSIWASALLCFVVFQTLYLRLCSLQSRLRIDFRSALPQVGPGLAAVLEGLLEPTPEDR